jgi:hypothetical protein
LTAAVNRLASDHKERRIEAQVPQVCRRRWGLSEHRRDDLVPNIGQKSAGDREIVEILLAVRQDAGPMQPSQERAIER